MSYSAEISRANPSCFLFLVDQSGSMADPFGVGDSISTKADGVADAINRLLQNLSIKCAKSEGVRDYYYVGVIGYGNDVGPAFGGNLAGRDLVVISEVAGTPALIEERKKKIDDGAGGLVDQVVRFPIWFNPVAQGGTPMCKALSVAERYLKEFLDAHPDCFPPTVVHLTDGESTDGDPRQSMDRIRSLGSSDGNVLLFNYHVSSNPGQPIAFPDTPEGLPDQYAKLLFDAASPLTPFMRDAARDHGFDLSAEAKGFTFNADLVLVIQALDIGTRPSNLR